MKAIILGGTGTLGTALAREILKDAQNEITIFSRCEFKQKQMAHAFGPDAKRLRFILGDIRDRGTLDRALPGHGVAFHVAALKHVDTLEYFPEESIKTNVLGTLNVAEAAIAAGLKHVVFSSTDKAVDPINTYGYCKALSEKILFKKNAEQSTTRFAVYRWGNVVGSRGSVIPLFFETLSREKKVYVTDAAMTRFWVRIEDAVKYILETYQTAPANDALIPPFMKAAPLVDVINAVARLTNAAGYEVVYTGLRPGEKMHEALRSAWDARYITSNTAERLTDSELDDLVFEAMRA